MAEGKFGGGLGTLESPYLIEDADDLNAIRFNPSSNFKLANTINLGVYPYNNEKGWLPIDNFYGTLDGDGHKIIGLKIMREYQNNVGLFGNCYENTNITLQVKNLYIQDAHIVGNKQVGIVFGNITMNESAKIQTEPFILNCKVTGTVDGNDNVGMAIGYINWATSISTPCTAVKHLYVKGTEHALTKQTSYGGIIGGGDASWKQNITLDYVIGDVTFNRFSNGIETDLNPNFFSTSHNLTNAFYNKESWVYGNGTGGKDFKTLTYRDNLTDFDKQINSNGEMIWNFKKEERLPELSLFLKTKHFVKCSKGYYVFNFTNHKWEKALDKIITNKVAMEKAMTGIENITFSEWADLHNNIVPSGEKCYLVTLYEDTNGTTNKNIIENMSVSTITQTEAQLKRKNDEPTKVFSYKISFKSLNDDGALKYGDSIFKIEHRPIQ